MLQHLVSLVKKGAGLKQWKLAEIVRIEFFPVIESLDHCGDAFALAAHGFRVRAARQVTSDK